jgi:hypothetical protein
MKANKCELCEAELEFRVQGSTVGFFCTKCDWSLVTTQIPKIAQDITVYKLYLLSTNYKNTEQIRAISEIARVNFLQARAMMQENQSLILEGEALEIDAAKKVLDKLSIGYEIEPNFPY